MTSIRSSNIADIAALMRASENVRMPAVPAEVTAVRAAAARNHPKHRWTGVNMVKAGSAKDVNNHLGDSRDAARTMVSGNVNMWVVRHAYKTGEPMQAFLANKPADGKLKLQVTTMPSWHATARGDYQVKAEIQKLPRDERGLPKLDLDFVEKAMRSSPEYARALEQETGDSIGDLALSFCRFVDRTIHQKQLGPQKTNELMSKVIEDYGKYAMGMKFSRENSYNVRITAGDKTITKRFDNRGNEIGPRDRPKRTDKTHTATTSPEVEIDISQLAAGDKVVVQAWPDGSAGVHGYREARETVINL